MNQRSRKHGFTLIETLVAISLLALAIVAPMALTTQSLSSAYYARDQMTAFHLAQEAIESVRAARDANILAANPDLLAGIPKSGSFVIDARDNTMIACDSGGTCPYMRVPLDPSAPVFYAYGDVGLVNEANLYTTPLGWTDTRFRRTVTANFVGGSTDEIEITAVVAWQTGAFQARSVTLRENLYRWVNFGEELTGSHCGSGLPQCPNGQSCSAEGSCQ